MPHTPSGPESARVPVGARGAAESRTRTVGDELRAIETEPEEWEGTRVGHVPWLLAVSGFGPSSTRSLQQPPSGMKRAFSPK
jgi:hypothetical protein